MSSNAKLFFETIRNRSDPFDFLSNIPSPPRSEPFFEEEWLDFKGKPQDDDNAKKIWSKALSGYANITDGLIIWGIDARKTQPRDIDAASGLRLIQDPKAFESKLRDWIRDATNPPVMGVEYESYTDSSTGEGFVVCYVPESRHKPHRAEQGTKYYYYRAGDDFLPAEPGLLRILFYPQVQPYLWLELKLKYKYSEEYSWSKFQSYPGMNDEFNKVLNGQSEISCSVELHNTGAATAKNVYIVVKSDGNPSLSIDSLGPDWGQTNNVRGQLAFFARRHLHPGDTTYMFKTDLLVSYPNTSSEQTGDIVPYFKEHQIRFYIYSDNSLPLELDATFKPEDFDRKTRSFAKQVKPES